MLTPYLLFEIILAPRFGNVNQNLRNTQRVLAIAIGGMRSLAAVRAHSMAVKREYLRVRQIA